MMDLEGKGKGIIKEGVDHLEKIYPEAFAAVSTTRRKRERPVIGAEADGKT
jgi:hypothetical protein